MSKFFVMSDIHGFYDEMKLALDEAGFDPNNEDHWIITCGDHFDRGPKPTEVMRYLRSLSRKILVLGNHEELLVQCCESGYPNIYDYSNGTYDTVCNIGDAREGYSFDECCNRTLAKIHLFLDSMVDYFETKNYIFVHSWFPLISKDGLPSYYTKNRQFEFNPNWREASAKEWADSRWGNPFELAEQGLNKTGKTIIFGHWATEHKWAEIEDRQDFDENAKFEPYYGDGYIGIDGTTVYSGKVNVIVIEDEFMEDSI
jgi:serine/threonine protein phosphatase 1